MGIWKDKKSGKWKYSFQANGIAYGGGGFKNKREATAAREFRRVTVSKLPNTNDIKDETMDSFVAKYKKLYDDPQITIACIFDAVMRDVGIPVRFKDIPKSNKKRVTIPAKLRMKVLESDDFSCKMCGRRPPEVKLHVDHIVPVSKGGITELRNLQTLCRECNLGKSDRHIMVVG